jgi:hypothetical protein
MPTPIHSLAAVLVAAALAGCAATAPHGPLASVPAKLQPGDGESMLMVVPARGVQLYECRARKEGAGFEWAFVAPEADLFDRGGQRIGRHYAGPHWEALDGSKVVGAVRERADAPTAGAIPWLLLSARASGPAGAFSRVSSIQRVNTVGGNAPQGGCAADSAGRTTRVAYTADYYLFARR